MLRDADKIDIYKVVTEYYTSDEANETIGLDLPDNDHVSESIIENIMNRRTVDHKEMKSLNDFKLLQMAWVYDLNFQFSRNVIAQNGYLDIIYQTLPQTASVEHVYNELKRHLA